MGYRSIWRKCYFVLAISFLSMCQPVPGSQASVLSRQIQDNAEPQRSNPTVNRQTQREQDKTGAKNEHGAPLGITPAKLPQHDKPTSHEDTNPEDTQQSAMSLLELVLSGSDQITPVEYNVLTRVEAARHSASLYSEGDWLRRNSSGIDDPYLVRSRRKR